MQIGFLRKKTPALTDDELLLRFRETGNIEVLAELYTRYTHLVYGVCLKYLKDREESKDAVMDIFEKLVAVVSDHEIKNFRSWLHVVTKNHCLMLLRSARKEEKDLGAWMAESENFMENSIVLHPVDRDDGLNDEALTECIEKLKEEQRTCIKLFYYSNKCYAEIADMLKTDEKKVKSHLQNGKRNLKICLGGTDEE